MAMLTVSQRLRRDDRDVVDWAALTIACQHGAAVGELAFVAPAELTVRAARRRAIGVMHRQIHAVVGQHAHRYGCNEAGALLVFCWPYLSLSMIAGRLPARRN